MIEQNLRYLFLLNAVLITAATFRRSVPEEEMVKCHTGVRVGLRRQCNAYRTGTPLELSSSNDFPELPEFCYNITWREANQNNNWGNCVEMTIDDQFRYITSNNVPDYYFNPYCPIGLGYGYCVPQETHCFFPDIICGEDNGEGTTPFGDVWVPEVHHFKFLWLETLQGLIGQEICMMQSLLAVKRILALHWVWLSMETLQGLIGQEICMMQS